MKDIVVNSKVKDMRYDAIRLVIDNETNEYCLDKPSIVFDGNKYNMWYVTNDNGKRRINYVTSEDGKTWINHNIITLIDSDDNISIQHPYVIFDNDVYKMWYVGRDNNKRHKIYYATSEDGINWIEHGIVVIKGSGDNCNIRDTYFPCIIYNNSTFNIWYTSCEDGVYRTYYATSENGIIWNRHDVVKILYSDGEIYELTLYSPSVIFDDGIYRMWYNVCNGCGWGIHYATSTDGVVWTNRGIVMSVGDIDKRDNIMVKTPFVMLDKDKYKVWYGGYNDIFEWKLYYAELYPDILENTLNIK